MPFQTEGHFCWPGPYGTILSLSRIVIRPVGCVAIATDGHNSLAMLVRRRGETLTQVADPLHLAIAKALTEDIFTDEINVPSTK